MSPSSPRFWQRVLAWSGPLLLLFCASCKLAEWVTDRWWFQSLGYDPSFERIMTWRTGAFILGGGVFLVWLSVNARFAWRNAERTVIPLSFFETEESPAFLPGHDQEVLDLFRRRLTLFFIGLLSWLAGLGCASRYLLFASALNYQNTGITDKASGFDLGFFLFELPFWNWLSRFCLSAITAALFLVVAIYLYEELIGPAVRIRRLPPALGKHLGMLWCALLLWKGFDCLLAVPNSFVSSGNVATRVFDPLDIRLGWTSAAIFAFLSPLVAAASGVAIARRARLQTFLIGLGWMICASGAPVFLPLIVGHDPSNAGWRTAVKRHIESTRYAWGLDRIESKGLNFKGSTGFVEEDARATQASHIPVALWPANTVRDAMNERLRGSDQQQRIERVWLEQVNAHLVYTGVAAPAPAPTNAEWRSRHRQGEVGRVFRIDASRAGAGGTPIFVSDIELPLRFGSELEPTFDSRSPELPSDRFGDAVEASNDENNWTLLNSDEGLGGAKAATFSQRLALSLRFFDPGFVSGVHPSNDAVVWNRGAARRCDQIAPFLDWHNDGAFTLLDDGRGGKKAVWLVAGIVWSDDYPDSAAPASIGTTSAGSNYGRQVAVGVVDAATGRTTLYSIDEDEPYLTMYRRILPGLFQPSTSLPSNLREHVRPCSELLSAQALIWARYHEDSSQRWVTRADDWRPLLTPVDDNDSTLRTLASGSGQAWQIMAFSTPEGQADSKGPASQLAAMLGIDQTGFLDREGKARLVSWTANKPLPLPELVTERQTRYNTGVFWPPAPLVTVAPRFDQKGEISGLIAARGSYKSRDEASVIATVDQAVGGDAASREEDGLNVKLALLGSGRDGAKVSGAAANSATENLVKARSAWNQVLEARRQGDWNAAGLAEKDLISALNAP